MNLRAQDPIPDDLYLIQKDGQVFILDGASLRALLLTQGFLRPTMREFFIYFLRRYETVRLATPEEAEHIQQKAVADGLTLTRVKLSAPPSPVRSEDEPLPEVFYLGRRGNEPHVTRMEREVVSEYLRRIGKPATMNGFKDAFYDHLTHNGFILFEGEFLTPEDKNDKDGHRLLPWGEDALSRIMQFELNKELPESEPPLPPLPQNNGGVYLEYVEAMNRAIMGSFKISPETLSASAHYTGDTEETQRRMREQWSNARKGLIQILHTRLFGKTPNPEQANPDWDQMEKDIWMRLVSKAVSHRERYNSFMQAVALLWDLFQAKMDVPEELMANVRTLSMDLGYGGLLSDRDVQVPFDAGTVLGLRFMLWLFPQDLPVTVRFRDHTDLGDCIVGADLSEGGKTVTLRALDTLVHEPQPAVLTARTLGELLGSFPQEAEVLTERYTGDEHPSGVFDVGRLMEDQIKYEEILSLEVIWCRF